MNDKKLIADATAAVEKLVAERDELASANKALRERVEQLGEEKKDYARINHTAGVNNLKLNERIEQLSKDREQLTKARREVIRSEVAAKIQTQRWYDKYNCLKRLGEQAKRREHALREAVREAKAILWYNPKDGQLAGLILEKALAESGETNEADV